MRRIAELIRKELLQLRRDRRLLPLLLIAPVLQLGLLGYAATTDVRNVPVALCDLDRSAASRALVEAFTAGGDFRIVCRVDRLGDIDAVLAVVVPAGR